MLSSLPVTSNLPAAAPGPLPQGHGPGGADEARPGTFSRALDDASSPELERERSAPPQGRHAGPTKARSAGDSRHKAIEAKAAAPTATTSSTADDKCAGEGCLAPTAETDATEPEAPAEVCTLLADLQARAPVGTSAPHEAAGGAKAPAAGEADVGNALPSGKALPTDGLRGAVQSRQVDLPAAPADRRGSPAAPGRPEPVAAAEPQAAAPSTAAERLAATAASLHGEAPLPVAPAAAPQVSASPATGAVKAAEATEATIAAHPASAEFAPQLGASVATFVRNGVEHARLQLHPAELGPVQVQIQLEGNNAQVMMGAEHPLTRQALEQSLPMLAATLREAGLTLAGGGVFEQARQGAGDGTGEPRSDGSRGGRGTGDAEAPPVRVQPPRSRGVVDLVA